MFTLVLCTLSSIHLYVHSATALRNPIVVEALYIEGHHQADFLLETETEKTCNRRRFLKLPLCRAVIWKLVNDPTDGTFHDLFLNVDAFKEREPVCKRIVLTFVTRLADTERAIQQLVFPCYGQHQPLRTSTAADDYYDTIFVSHGTRAGAVMVYKHEKMAGGNVFRPLEEYYNLLAEYTAMMNTREVSPTSFQIETQWAEPEVVLEVSYNDNEAHVETIYIREMIFEGKMRVPDPLGGLEQVKLVELCGMLFNCRKYQNEGFQLNKTAFLELDIRDAEGDEQTIVFTHEVNYNPRRFQQPMYPCFGQSPESSVPWSEDEKLHEYRISYGPRRSSILIYKFQRLAGHSGFRPVELVENFKFDELQALTTA